VLKITLPSCEDDPLFILEGRLTGEWAKELLRVTRELGPRTTSIFDIEEVSYVDQLGEETLRWLNRLGATFVTRTAYGKDLCRRLHLRHAAAARSKAPKARKPKSVKVPPDPSPPSS
jgi:hypothetical protein